MQVCIPSPYLNRSVSSGSYSISPGLCFACKKIELKQLQPNMSLVRVHEIDFETALRNV